MIGFFKSKLKDNIKIGDVRAFKNDDPFKKHNGCVEVLAVKDGWVKYRFLETEIEWTKSLESFKNVYTIKITNK